MGKRHEKLSDEHVAFIERQRLFFVGTATTDSRINISPKGMDSFRILTNDRVVWLNLTGSGNETAAHVQHQPRMTIMFCAFEGAPLILRLYGTAKVIHRKDAAWDELYPSFTPRPGARQLFDLRVEMVQTSCGMGVPLYTYRDDRDSLTEWASRQGEEGLKQYWESKNQLSLDGVPTNILERNL